MTAALDVLAQLRLEDGSSWVERSADWQLADARAILDGPRPFSFITRPRGGSKTSDLSGIAIAWLLSAPEALRYYAVAADRDQARLLLDSLAGFARRSPQIAAALQIDTWKVTAIASGATLTILASDTAGSWGIRPDGVVIDELAWWTDTAAPQVLLDSLLSSAAKTPGCRVAVITSPSSPSHFSHKLRDHAAEDPLWRLSEVEGPVPWLPEERIEEQRRRLSPTMFERLFMGRWTEADDALSDSAALREAVAHDGPLDPRPGIRYVIGLDLGLKRDRTVAAVCHREDERVVLDRIAVWQGSRLKPVQIGEVEEWLQQAAGLYNGARIIADPWQSVGLVQRLRDGGIRCEEFSFTAQSVGKIAGALFNLLRDRRLALPDDEELLDELAHVRLRESSPGTFRLDHDSGRHDDRAVAVALAAHRLLTDPAPGPAVSVPSPFEARGRFRRWAARQRRTAEDDANRPAIPTRPPTPERVGNFLIRR